MGEQTRMSAYAFPEVSEPRSDTILGECWSGVPFRVNPFRMNPNPPPDSKITRTLVVIGIGSRFMGEQIRISAYAFPEVSEPCSDTILGETAKSLEL
jgi:hypothetical protein